MTAGVWYAIGTAVGLGAITTQAKLVYADGGNALTLMLARFAFSVLVIGVVARVSTGTLSIDRAHWRAILPLGLVWCGSMILYLVSVQTISVSLAVLLLYTYPLLVLLYTVLSGQIQATPRLVCLFLAAFAGIGLALFSGEVVVDTQGVILAFLAGCGAAYTFVAGARVAPRCNPVVLTFWVNMAGLVLIVPLMAGQFSPPTTSAGLLLLGGATVCYIGAVLCQFQALARLPAQSAAFLLNLEPVVSVVLAAVVLGETLSLTQWVGVVLVFTVLFAAIRTLSSQEK